MSELIIVRGPPGSGKSTFAKKLQFALGGADNEDQYTHVEADMFFGTPYIFVPSQVPLAHKWCKDRTRDILESGGSAIVSNTFSRVWEMQPYIDMANELGARLTVIEVQGNHGSVHNVPEESINKMKQRWEKYP